MIVANIQRVSLLLFVKGIAIPFTGLYRNRPVKFPEHLQEIPGTFLDSNSNSTFPFHGVNR